MNIQTINTSIIGTPENHLPPAFVPPAGQPTEEPTTLFYTILNAVDDFLDIGGAMEAWQRARARHDSEGSRDSTMRLAIAISYVASLVFQTIEYTAQFCVALSQKVESFLHRHGLAIIAPAHVVLGAAVCGILTSSLTFLYEFKNSLQLSRFLNIFREANKDSLSLEQRQSLATQLNKIANLGHAKLEHRLQPWFVQEKLLGELLKDIQVDNLNVSEPMHQETLILPNKVQALATKLLNTEPQQQDEIQKVHTLAAQVLGEMRLQATKKLCVHVLGLIGCALALTSTALFLTLATPASIPLIFTLVSTAFYVAQYVVRTGMLDNKEGGFSALNVLPLFLQRKISCCRASCQIRPIQLRTA